MTANARKRKSDADESALPLTRLTGHRADVRCALCGFAAASLEQSLAHLREQHDGSAAGDAPPRAVGRSALVC